MFLLTSSLYILINQRGFRFSNHYSAFAWAFEVMLKIGFKGSTLLSFIMSDNSPLSDKPERAYVVW